MSKTIKARHKTDAALQLSMTVQEIVGSALSTNKPIASYTKMLQLVIQPHDCESPKKNLLFTSMVHIFLQANKGGVPADVIDEMNKSSKGNLALRAAFEAHAGAKDAGPKAQKIAQLAAAQSVDSPTPERRYRGAKSAKEEKAMKAKAEDAKTADFLATNAIHQEEKRQRKKIKELEAELKAMKDAAENTRSGSDCDKTHQSGSESEVGSDDSMMERIQAAKEIQTAGAKGKPPSGRPKRAKAALVTTKGSSCPKFQVNLHLLATYSESDVADAKEILEGAHGKEHIESMIERLKKKKKPWQMGISEVASQPAAQV